MGKTGEETKELITAEWTPTLEPGQTIQVIVLPEGSMVTRDYRLDRVRIFVNDAGIVVREPRVT